MPQPNSSHSSSSSSGTKRPHPGTSSSTAADDIRAECPFTVRIVDPREKEFKPKGKKRRKRGHSKNGDHLDDRDSSSSGRKILQQCAPFSPKGAFETHSTMDVHYVVEPSKQWSDMTRYNSFVLNGVKYYCEGFIYVANESSVERQRASNAAPSNGDSNGSGRDPRKRSDDDWVARILEIRASDEHHVYARVFWMYWPDELPANTHYGKKLVEGRQPYHGASELIASNHMDIINVVSVTSMATVNHLNEDKDDDVQSALYWRQALDVRTMELSAIENVCDCEQPANPDKMLVGCGDPACGKWIHEECLKHYALMRVYDRLGRDKPHIPERKPPLGGPGAVKPETEDVKEPLSPRESGGAVSAQHSIDVKADTVEVAGDEEQLQQQQLQQDNGVDVDGEEDDDDEPRRGGRGGKKANAVAIREKGRSADEDDDEDEDDEDHGDRTNSNKNTPRKPKAEANTPSVSTTELSAIRTKSESGAAAGGLATPTAATAAAGAGANASTPTSTAGTGKGGRKRYPSIHALKKKPYDKLFEATLLLGPPSSASHELSSSSSPPPPGVAAATASAIASSGSANATANASANASANAGANASSSPTMIEIRDLRTNVTGGVKVWLEPAECPICGSAIR